MTYQQIINNINQIKPNLFLVTTLSISPYRTLRTELFYGELCTENIYYTPNNYDLINGSAKIFFRTEFSVRVLYGELCTLTPKPHPDIYLNDLKLR